MMQLLLTKNTNKTGGIFISSLQK